MAERRTLAAGLAAVEDIDPALAKDFVYGDKTKTDAAAKPPAAEPRDAKGQAATGRTPLTPRVRSDFAAALKRASLERQLAGVFPNTLQDILEEALQPWLRANGYAP